MEPSKVDRFLMEKISTINSILERQYFYGMELYNWMDSQDNKRESEYKDPRKEMVLDKIKRIVMAFDGVGHNRG